jgi:hypothetical protein
MSEQPPYTQPPPYTPPLTSPPVPKKRKNWPWVVLAVIVGLVGIGALAGTDTTKPQADTSDAVTGGGNSYSVAEKLSAIDTGGSTSEEADEFQRALDCVVGTMEGTETEAEVADTWVAGWNATGKDEGALLELARATCAVVS